MTQDLYAIQIQTDELMPRIRPGEFAIVDAGAVCVPGDEVVIETRRGNTLIRVLQLEGRATVGLGSINGKGAPTMLSRDRIACMHRLVAVTKDRPTYA